MENKAITEDQNVLLAEVDQNYVYHIPDKQSMVHKDTVPEGKRVNSAFYVQVLECYQRRF